MTRLSFEVATRHHLRRGSINCALILSYCHHTKLWSLIIQVICWDIYNFIFNMTYFAAWYVAMVTKCLNVNELDTTEVG